MTNRADVRVLRSVDELERLAPEWISLSQRFQSPLLDHDWFACAAAAFHRESDLRVVTVRHQGVLTGVAPMAVDPVQRHLVLLGSAALYEPSGWLYSSDEALRALSRAVVGVGDVVMLNRIASSSRLCEALPKFLRWHAMTIVRETADSFVVPTNRPWDDYLSSLSLKTRRKLAASKLKAERQCGEVRFVRMEPTPDQAVAALELLVRIEATGWKGRQGSALSVKPDLLGFFRAYLARAAAKQRLRVSALWLGDQLAAVEVGIEAYGRMWGLKLAYDEKFSQFAPAVQLVHFSIAAASRVGLDAYEFLGSAEPWQLRWRPAPREYRLTAVYPLSGRAIATAMWDAKSYVSRRLKRRVAAETALA